MKYFKVFFSIATIMSSTASYAYEAPSQVLRVSVEAPSTVFENGLSSLGPDTDLLRHVSGVSVLDGTSNYVTTTETVSVAREIAQVALRLDPSRSHWVYIIRPTINFFSVSNSLIDARFSLTDRDAQRQAIILWNAFHWQDAWAAQGSISSSQILGVHPVISVNNAPVLGDFVPNPNYTPGTPTVNPNVMPAQHATSDIVYLEESEHSARYVSLNLYPTCDHQCHQLSLSNTSPAPTQFSYEALQKRTVASLIAKGTILVSMDGKPEDVPGHDEL